jgi:acyl carrier protein
MVNKEFNTEESIFNEIQAIVVEQLGIEKDRVTLEASFVNELGADSLDTVELVMAIEERFDIEIPDDIAEQITTPGDAVKHIFAEVQA